jgi:hypothetical protein
MTAASGRRVRRIGPLSSVGGKVRAGVVLPGLVEALPAPEAPSEGTEGH